MLKVKFDNLLIGIVLAIVIVWDTLNTTVLNRTLPQLPIGLLFLVVLILCIRFRFIKNIPLYYIIIAPILLFSGIEVYCSTGKADFLLYSLLIVLLLNAKIESILKIYVIFVGSIVLLVVFLSFLGIIPNLQFVQERLSGTVVRNSFGFIYPTDFASHCFYLFLAISYLLKDKIIWILSIIGLLLSYFVLKYCDARLNALSIFIATLIFLFFYYMKNTKLKVYAILPFSVPILSSLMYYLSSRFTWASPFYVLVNNLMSMRLHLGKEALSKYDLYLFGTKGIQFIGYGGSTESVYSYNYVDSSYIQMLFTYGIFPLIILIILYVLQSWKSYKQGNYLLLAILSLVSVNCMIEAFWIRPSYDIFMYIMFASITFPKKESELED